MAIMNQFYRNNNSRVQIKDVINKAANGHVEMKLSKTGWSCTVKCSIKKEGMRMLALDARSGSTKIIAIEICQKGAENVGENVIYSRSVELILCALQGERASIFAGTSKYPVFWSALD